MILFILQVLYFFLPAYVANMAPVVFRFIPYGAKPISEKVFGKHKTIRGLIVGTLMGGLVFFLQQVAYRLGFDTLALIDYADFPLIYGFLLGAGALLGDLLKSYYKRKDGIAPGEKWIPFDQLDFVVGGIAFSFFVYVPSIGVVVTLLIISPLLHIGVNHLAFWLGIRKEKW